MSNKNHNSIVVEQVPDSGKGLDDALVVCNGPFFGDRNVVVDPQENLLVANVQFLDAALCHAGTS